MIRFGTLLTVLGLGSALLHFTSVQFRLLIWSEPYQPVLGLSIGAAGVALIIVKVVTSKDSPEQAAPGSEPAQFGPPPAAPHGAQQAYGAPQSYGPPSGPQPVGAQPSVPQPAAPQSFGAPQGYGPLQPYGPPQHYPPQAPAQPQNGQGPYGGPPQFGPQGGPQQFGPRG